MNHDFIRRLALRRNHLLALPLVAALAAPAKPQSGLMDYRDAREVGERLAELADGSPHAQLYTIGYSTDWYSSSSKAGPVSWPIHALRISASPDETIEDDYRKNSILFEAGMHPREWLTTEACLMLAEHLVARAPALVAYGTLGTVPELLAEVDVWIIPLSTPAGRAIDDRDGGDPRSFSTSPNAGGWRGNGDTRECPFGVNVARNFSRGWTAASPAFDQNYRGFAPFSTEEATALRSFVQNHGISMAVVVHSGAENIWNMWGEDGDRAGNFNCVSAGLVWLIGLIDLDLALARGPLGRGTGQLTAWLSKQSNTAGEPDRNTLRAIQTTFVELPFVNYPNVSGGFRYQKDDPSNGFHPSGSAVRDLVQSSFIPMAEELIRQARSPGCATLAGIPSLASCPEVDFGLVGAKFCAVIPGVHAFDAHRLRAGRLESYAAVQIKGGVVPARDWLAAGPYTLEYRVQRFGSGLTSRTADDVDVRVVVKRSTVVVSSTIVTFRDLAIQEIRTGSLPLDIDLTPSDYEVSIQVRPAGGFVSGVGDDFAANNTKRFAFRSYAP